MDDAKADAGPEATRNLAALVAMLVIGACLWWWFDFSGPFRWLIDLELRLFGNWWEPSAAIVLGLGGIAVVLSLMVAVKWLLPNPSAVVVNLLVCAILVVLTAAALVEARQLWSDAARLPGLRDPVRSVTLAELDGGAPPLGHVRLLGTPRQDRSVTLSLHDRARGHTDTYVPLNVDAGGRVRVVATRTERGMGGDASRIPADPEGVLLSDAIDTRTRYQLRREGLPVADRVFVLFWPGSDVSTDGQIEAILLAAPALLFWPFAGWDAWRRRRAGGAVIAPAPVRRRPAPVAPAPVAVPAATDDGWQFLRDASPSGVGMLAGGGLLFALWEWGWVLPGDVEVWSYVVAGLLLVVSFVLEMLPGGRPRPAEPDPAPSADAALLYLMPDGRPRVDGPPEDDPARGRPAAAASMSPNSDAQQPVYRQAMRHLADALGVQESELARMPWPDSAANKAQFALMKRDLKEVADKQLLFEMEFGTLLVTLHMYGAQMVRCSAIDPAKVDRVLARA
jgi:hypothetical protein